MVYLNINNSINYPRFLDGFILDLCRLTSIVERYDNSGHFHIESRKYLFEALTNFYKNDTNFQIEDINIQKENCEIMKEYNNHSYFHIDKRRKLIISVQKYIAQYFIEF